MAASVRVPPHLAIIAGFLVATPLTSCIPLALGGAAATGGYVAGQERGVGQMTSDTVIRAKINDAWYRYNSEMASQLSLSVYEGRVLITGTVANPEWKPEAVRLAWQAEGVKEVNDEIQFSEQSSIGDAARDELIKTRLRSALLFDSGVRSMNYTIDVVNGIVYLSGSARTQGELDKVTDYARNIPNVKRVVNYAKIRPGEPQAPGSAPVAQSFPAQSSPAAGVSAGAPPAQQSYQQPAQTPGSSPNSPAPYGAPPSGSGSGKIEVTPLQ